MKTQLSSSRHSFELNKAEIAKDLTPLVGDLTGGHGRHTGCDIAIQVPLSMLIGLRDTFRALGNMELGISL